MKTQKSIALVGILIVLTVLGLLFATCSDPLGDPTDGNPVPVTGITLNKTSLSLAVGQEETLAPTVTPSDATNKAVTWLSSDTSKATVANGVVKAVAAGTARITVTTVDGGFTANCNVTVRAAGSAELAVTGVTLDHTTLILIVGGSQTLTATVEPEDATVKTVGWASNAPTIAIVDADGKVEAKAAGTAKITVTTDDGDFTAECAVTVTLVPVSIAVTTPPAKTLYAAGETLDITGLVVTATYGDNSTGIVTVTAEDITGFDPDTPGEQILTVTYGGKPATFTVTVLALTKIEITHSPEIVAIGEELDIGGIEIEATWGDDTTEKFIKKKVEITIAHISGFDKDKAESQTVTVTYEGKTDTFIVLVMGITGIIIDTPPTKTLYKIGESLNLDGLVVKVAFSNGTTETVNITAEHISGFSSATAGEKTLTITYSDQTATFTVTVIALAKITIDTPPTKTLYKTGEMLDITGLVVKATWGDDSTDKYITDAVTITAANITGFSSATAGDKTLTVTYSGQTATFTVTVLAVTKIAITSQPTKTRYSIGDSLDIAGLVVKATWGDDSTDKYITETVTITATDISGFDSATAGTKTLTVSYGGQTTTFTVTVVAVVTFNPNGGNWDGSTANKIVEVDQIATITKPDNPAREGYTFGEWYKDVALTNQWNFAADTVSIDTTLYAKWNPITYTVRYDKNDTAASGTMADSSHTYDVEKALTANGYTLTDHAFGGWNTESDYSGTNYANKQTVKNLTATAGSVVTLYAVWLTQDALDFGLGVGIDNTFNVANTTQWNSAVTSITSGGNNKNYIINITANFTVAGYTSNTFGNVTGLKVSIRGVGRTLSLSSNGRILRVRSNQTVILRDVTLQGLTTNNTYLVFVEGTFTMYDGKITGNRNTYSDIGSLNGGGVYVSNGTFTMNGGEISNNSVVINYPTSTGPSVETSAYGGGVYVTGANSTFTMNGGTIRNNSSTASNNRGISYAYGGGVYLANGTFTMDGGEISDNTVSASSNSSGGCGVEVYFGTFTMHSGKISGNTGSSGGGVNLTNSSFTMNSGEISGNRGGVRSDRSSSITMNSGKISGNSEGVNLSSGTFNMYGGKISGNTNTYSNYGGGGVEVGWNGHFNMHGGEISGNTANRNGGGVCVQSGADFNMHGGEISGNTANGNGGGVYVSSRDWEGGSDGYFSFVSGTVYGSGEAGGIKNTATSGAALYIGRFVENGTYYSGRARYGTFNGSTWVTYIGLDTTDNTIRVENGKLYYDLNGAPAVELVNGQWTDGDIVSYDLYKFAVTAGTTYYIWGNSSGVQGNGTKTGWIQVRAMYSDIGANLISGQSDWDWGSVLWTSPISFTASKNDTVYLMVRPILDLSSYAGTYGIVYSTNSTRPDVN
jgi:uncharacterized repeat protein (TIGR02543 family)